MLPVFSRGVDAIVTAQTGQGIGSMSERHPFRRQGPYPLLGEMADIAVGVGAQVIGGFARCDATIMTILTVGGGSGESVPGMAGFTSDPFMGPGEGERRVTMHGRSGAPLYGGRRLPRHEQTHPEHRQCKHFSANCLILQNFNHGCNDLGSGNRERYSPWQGSRRYSFRWHGKGRHRIDGVRPIDPESRANVVVPAGPVALSIQG